MTYLEAAALFARARSYKGYRLPGREGSTRLVQVGDSYAIQFHQTNVVTMHPDGTYTLRNGGWFSPSTKERIEMYAPVNLNAHLGRWLIGDWRAAKAAHFHSGVRISSKGRILSGAKLQARSVFQKEERDARNARARERRAAAKAAYAAAYPERTCAVGAELWASAK